MRRVAFFLFLPGLDEKIRASSRALRVALCSARCVRLFARINTTGPRYVVARPWLEFQSQPLDSPPLLASTRSALFASKTSGTPVVCVSVGSVLSGRERPFRIGGAGFDSKLDSSLGPLSPLSRSVLSAFVGLASANGTRKLSRATVLASDCRSGCYYLYIII